ncbi:TrmH family RNA methyltransferase [Novosphingobium sp. EMRT-2]|uniref:TrmH family RNA methyltransferase n=1 Tax=Novosphingobium sp. EMRT-2 TaxID=2571749 RepID=UPI00143DB3C1|nr:TrmH family RNA methyltransferase [Novosphingobium sp. EMRT-2]
MRLWGRHAVEAALTNPDRVAKKLWGTREAIQAMLDDHDAELPASCRWNMPRPADLGRLWRATRRTRAWCSNACRWTTWRWTTCWTRPTPDAGAARPVTDPHNVGAILRSCAAFGVAAIVTRIACPARIGHAGQIGLGRARNGALVRVVNLARALESIAEAGYWRIGLDGDGKDAFPQAVPTAPSRWCWGPKAKGFGTTCAALRFDRALADLLGDRKPERVQRRRDRALRDRHACSRLNRKGESP